MAKKKLNNEEIEKVANFLQNGKTPQDIAEHFGIAVSSVHNYKTRMKKKGIELPNVRGQRPKGMNPDKQPSLKIAKDEKSYRLVVGTITIEITGQLKGLKIEPDHIRIEY